MRLFTLFLLFVFPCFSKAQTAEISGIIYQRGKMPLANANIYIDGSYDGANSDSLGRFNFNTTLTGEQFAGGKQLTSQSACRKFHK